MYAAMSPRWRRGWRRPRHSSSRLSAVQRRGRTGPDAGGKLRARDDGDDWARSEARSGEDRDLLRTEPEPRRGRRPNCSRQSRQALLIGEGGSGKSRCLAALALEAARDWQPGRPWPLLVSLSAYYGRGAWRDCWRPKAASTGKIWRR